jgi:hypothetical protein
MRHDVRPVATGPHLRKRTVALTSRRAQAAGQFVRSGSAHERLNLFGGQCCDPICDPEPREPVTQRAVPKRKCLEINGRGDRI